MRARNVFRGLAAATLSAALVVGGALGTPAFAEESFGTAAQQADSPLVSGDASESNVNADSELGAPAGETATGDQPGELPAVEPEPASDPATDATLDAVNGAPNESGTNSPEVPVPADPESAAQAKTSEPAVPTDQPEATQDVALKLSTTVKATQSLGVQVTATGLPADFAEVSAALIATGDEASLLGPENQLPAIASPKPQVQDGKANFTLTAPVERLTRGTQYVVVLWPSDTKPEAANLFARADAAVTTAQWGQLFGPLPPVAEEGSISWGVLERFRNYVMGPIAQGEIEAKKPARYNGETFTFPQIRGGSWNTATQLGKAQYGGDMHFTGHDGVLDLRMSNPVISVLSPTRAELSVTSVSTDRDTLESSRSVAVIAVIDLATATRSERGGGAVRWSNAKATLTKAGVPVFQDFYEAGQPLDPITFTVGSERDVKPITPPKPKPVPKPTPKPVPKPLPPTTVDGGATGAQAAGSLSWGVSSAFSSYVTGPIAKGAVTTSGVGSSGGGYLFPQAAGGSWDTATQTGSVQYSGVISFTGHKGLLSESMSNPMIQVTGPDTGVIYNGGAQWGTLNLAAASKSVGPNGEVTWSGVPVSGGFSGGASGGSQYTLAADPLTFTVGTASGVSYGSTAVSNDSLKRTAAASAPTTSGIRILTDTKKIVPGGEIELEAPGFTAKEREALVVLYPGVIVLDEAAGADASGTVRWIGTIPEDLPLGEYVITVQGSTDAGAVMEVRKPEPKAKAAAKQQRVAELAAQAEAGEPAAAGVLPAAEAQATWMWWAASLGLLLVAGVMGGLVVAQRRNAAAAHTPGSGS